MISRMLLTLSGPSRKNATMQTHNSTQKQCIMQRATFFSRDGVVLVQNCLHICYKVLHKSLWKVEKCCVPSACGSSHFPPGLGTV